MFLIEGSLISLVGALLGALAGIGYASLMMAGLRVLVAGGGRHAIFASVVPADSACWSVAGVGVIASLTTIWWTLRSLRGVSERQLLAGVTQAEPKRNAAHATRGSLLGWLLLGIAVVLGVDGRLVAAARRRPVPFSAAGAVCCRRC